MTNYVIYHTLSLEVKGTTEDPTQLLGDNLAIVSSDFPANKTLLIRDEEGQVVAVEKQVVRSQEERYKFLKALMLEIAGSLSKSPQEAFALKDDIEELKFWAELGAAEAVIAKLESLNDNAIFTKSLKKYIIDKIQSFLNDKDT